VLRIETVQPRPKQTEIITLADGNVVIDRPGHQLRVEQTPRHLDPTQFRFLDYLADAVDRTRVHDDIALDVWGAIVTPDILHTTATRVRRALGAYAALLQTQRTIGYKLLGKLPPKEDG